MSELSSEVINTIEGISARILRNQQSTAVSKNKNKSNSRTKAPEDPHMKVVDYLNYLLNFYTELSQYPLAKLSYYDQTMKIEARFKDQVSVLDYKVGFIIGKTCYISGKRAAMNMRILEEFLSPAYDDFMLSVKINRKNCEIYAYNVFGRRVLRGKIKFATINWFTGSTSNEGEIVT